MHKTGRCKTIGESDPGANEAVTTQAALIGL